MKAARLEGFTPTLNEDLADYVKFIHELLVQGKIKPNPILTVGGGFEAIPEAVAVQQKGTKGGEKVVVELQRP